MNGCVLRVMLIVVFLGLPSSALAQQAEAEAAAGGAWFPDESAIGHSLVGGSVRWRLTPKLAIGPEFTYWRGPGHDRDQTLTGNLTYTFRAAGLSPFVVAGAGLFRHSDRFVRDTFSSTEAGWTLGGGVRIPFRRRWYVAPETRLGWEPHVRLHVAIGRQF